MLCPGLTLYVKYCVIFQGDYRVNGRLVDTRTDEEIACYTVEFTIQRSEGSDWFSWS